MILLYYVNDVPIPAQNSCIEGKGYACMTKSPGETRALSDVNDGEDIGKYTMSVAVMLTGVEAYRIRRFEKAGLLKPDRSRAGQRRYSDTEIELIKGIAALEQEGINLQGVNAILAMRRGERE